MNFENDAMMMHWVKICKIIRIHNLCYKECNQSNLIAGL